MRKKKTETQKIVHPTPRYPDTSRRTTWENAGKTRPQYPNYKFWLSEGQRLKLQHELDGCPLQWPSD